jgi:hypothetical protein
MVMKATNAYQRLGLFYIRYIASLLHVSATLVATLREMSTTNILQEFFNQSTNVRSYICALVLEIM